MVRHARLQNAYLCLLLFLTAASCAGSGAGRAPSGYTHTYQLATGDVLHFETVTTSTVSSEMLAMVMPGPIEMRMPAVTRIEITGEERGAWQGRLVIEEFALEGLDEMMGGMGGMMGGMDLTGHSSDFTLRPDGRSDLAFSLGESGMPFGGNTMTSQGLNQYFIPWPDHPVSVGEAWTDSTTQEMKLGEGGAASITVITDCTYLGLLEEEGGGPRRQVVRAESRGSMAGDMSQAQMEMQIDLTLVATWTGWTEYRFDPRDGLLDTGSGELDMDMTMSMSVPMPMDIPMSIKMAFTVDRLR